MADTARQTTRRLIGVWGRVLPPWEPFERSPELFAAGVVEEATREADARAWVLLGDDYVRPSDVAAVCLARDGGDWLVNVHLTGGHVVETDRISAKPGVTSGEVGARTDARTARDAVVAVLAGSVRGEPEETTCEDCDGTGEATRRLIGVWGRVLPPWEPFERSPELFAAGVVEEATREADALRTAAQVIVDLWRDEDYDPSNDQIDLAVSALEAELAVLAGSVRGEPEETTCEDCDGTGFLEGATSTLPDAGAPCPVCGGEGVTRG